MIGIGETTIVMSSSGDVSSTCASAEKSASLSASSAGATDVSASVPPRPFSDVDGVGEINTNCEGTGCGEADAIGEPEIKGRGLIDVIPAVVGAGVVLMSPSTLSWTSEETTGVNEGDTSISMPSTGDESSTGDGST